jgi:hypothetical protein
MLSISPAFIKVSPKFNSRLRELLAQAGIHGMSANSLIGAIVELGGPLFDGQILRVTLAKVGQLLYRSRAQVSRILKSLVGAGIISKVNKGRGGIELRLLELPESTTHRSALEPEIDERRELGVEIRLQEIEADQGGFRKGRKRTQTFLRTNMTEAEIDAALSRDQEKRESLKLKEAEASQKAALKVEGRRDQEKLLSKFSTIPVETQATILHRVLKTLPRMFQDPKPSNSIFTEERERRIRSGLLRWLQTQTS